MMFYIIVRSYLLMHIVIKFLSEGPLKNGFCRRATLLKTGPSEAEGMGSFTPSNNRLKFVDLKAEKAVKS